MRSLIVFLTACALAACGDAPPAPEPVEQPVPALETGEAPPAASWARVTDGEAVTLQLQEGDSLLAALTCKDDRIHAASDQFQLVLSEERFSLGAGDEAFTLVAILEAGRARGVEASGDIPPDLLQRIEAGQPLAFNYGYQNIGPFPPIPEADARAFAQACLAAAP